jgi:hypothetical protein
MFFWRRRREVLPLFLFLSNWRFSMKRFEFSVSFRLNGIVCSRKYTTHTKDIGIARAWIYATTAIDGLDVIEIIDLNK